MKLVVGLGNPGRKYTETRHNVGFRVLAELAARSAAGKPRFDFEAELVEASLGGQKVILAAPQTFMNLSGSSVLRLRDFYKLEFADLLVVCDDFNLPLGRLRMRTSGSAGGQKGLGDIIHRLSTESIPRLRIGIGSPPSGFETADFVLSKFRKEEQSEIELAIALAADAVTDWAQRGIDPAMNKFNSN
jgi:peptidyl-tRNA hydrolase, PTH1 family